MRALRIGLLAAAAAAFLGPLSAASADEIVLQAAPIPVVTVEVNGRPARFEVDATLPDVVVIDPAAAVRLGVRPAPMLKVAVRTDDLAINGRIGRPRIAFQNGKTARAFAGLFGVPYRDGAADGAIGPGVLPYDRVRIVLRAGAPGAHPRVLALAEAETWKIAAPIGDQQGAFTFNLARRETMLSRAATTLLEHRALIAPAGALATTQYPLGLVTSTQPVTSTQTLAGFAMGPTLARTSAPLVAPDGADVVVVAANARRRPDYEVTLGRAALAACSDMVWERRTARLTLMCD